MRILIAAMAGAGHVNPLRPLAAALRDSEHEVVWATGAEICSDLAADGFATRAVGPSLPALFGALAARTRGEPGAGIRPERKTHWFAPRLFGEVGVQLTADALAAAAREIQPDVMLFESRCYAAPAVARSAGAYPVLQAVTTLLAPEVEELVNDAVTPFWHELGLASPSFAGVYDGLTLSAFPASLDDPSPYPGLVVHRLAPPPPPQPPDWLDEWLAEREGRPLVYATLGTVFGDNAALLRSMIDGLAAQDVAVLLTVGSHGDVDALGTPPSHMRFERFVPQDTVLARCAAVVSHGGSGTTLAALAHGLPHVLLPQGADQFLNAGRAQQQGHGYGLLPAEQNAEHISQALQEVLTDPSYSERARQIQHEMRTGLTPQQAVDLIERTMSAALT
ncbi:MAG: glycosyltransferase [Mycobacteriales bacterium]